MKNIKLIMIFENLINEFMGISYEAREWAMHIFNKIKNENEGQITIDGHEDEELYHSFPVDYFIININDDLYAGGLYDENKSGYKDGKYYVYLNFPKDPELYAINHELRHAYEDYKRQSKGRPGLSKSKEGYNLFSGDFEKFITRQIKGDFGIFPYVMEALYFTSKLEESAYGETIHDKKDSFMWILSNKLRQDYTYKNQYNKEVLLTWWNNLKKNVKIPILNKFNNYENFLNWADKTIKYRGNIAMKKFLKIKYLRNK